MARRNRLQAGLDLLDLTAAASASQSTLSRFERGQGWPREIDRIISAYAQACGVTPEDLWRAALEAED